MNRMDEGVSGGTSVVGSTAVPEMGGQPERQLPLYLSILSRLRDHIAKGSLPAGAVIKEGPLATVFGVSRAPLRRALQMLEQDHILRRAKGQGFVVGTGAETGVIGASTLKSIFEDEVEVGRAATWESIFDSILLDVANCLPFGTFRISESIACEHFSVGRTALRESLGKLQDKGFLEKSNRSHWTAGPLTARDIHEAFAVRRLLEPAALRESAPRSGRSVVQAMHAKIVHTTAALDNTSPADVEKIEDALHSVLLKNCANRRMLEAIERNQFPFIVDRIFRRNFGLRPDRNALEDHAQILEQLLKGQTDVACTMLAAHLESAEENTLAKLRVLSILPKPETAPYLIKIH